MSTNPKHVEQMSSKTPSFKTIDREIKTLTAEMEQEQTLMPETQSGRIARLLKIYNGIKPLLTVISALPLIPSGWRAALLLFNNALARWPRARTTSPPTSRRGRISEARHADLQNRS